MRNRADVHRRRLEREAAAKKTAASTTSTAKEK